MIAKITRWGNSDGVQIPRALLEVVGLSDSEDVEIVAKDKMLIIRPARERLSIEKLFEDWDGEPPEPYSWGEQVDLAGRELI
ncbi:MAG: hypothetical protein FWE19_04670 [Oscillospiraceae bacterium]|nr:hypothetical protein [Oscillospiraceae bacterium]